MEGFELIDGKEEIKNVKCVYSPLPPFVDIKNENGREIIGGFMPAIMRSVTEWMNLNVTWVREPNNAYGSWNGTSFSGMVGMLAREEVDFIVNPLIPNNDVFRIADFMNPIIYEAFTMLSGKRKEEGGLFLYFSVLQPTVWAAIGITLIAIAIASAILFLRVSDGSYSCLRAVAEYLWLYVIYMLREGSNEKWMLRQSKSLISALMPFLIMSWLIGVAFLIMSVFQSLLVSKLTIIKQYPVIDSLEEFVRSKNVIGLTPREIELQLVLENSGIPVYDQTWQKLKPELLSATDVFSPKSLEGVEKGKYCIFHGHLILRSVLSEYFKIKGSCKFHLSENTFYPFPLLPALRKTLPKKFREKFNFGVTRLVDADLSGKWFKSIYEICHLCVSYNDATLKPLGLQNIYGVLVIWAVGMSSAAISLIAENIYFTTIKRKSQKKKRKRTQSQTF